MAPAVGILSTVPEVNQLLAGRSTVEGKRSIEGG